MKGNAGQVLTTLLFLMALSITITASGVAMLLSNAQNTTKSQESLLTYYVAESGVENALIRLLRNPDYTGETINFEQGQATVTISGSSTKTIISLGKRSNYLRKIQVEVSYNDGIFTVLSWKEIF